MKISLLIAGLILIIASFFGVQDRRKLVAAREIHGELTGQARALGLDPDLPVTDGDSGQPTKLARGPQQDREAVAKEFANKLAAFANEIKAIERSGGQPGEEMQRRVFAIMEEMLELDATQLKVLVMELRSHPDLDDEMRSGIVGFAIMSLANDHPRSALALFTESSDLYQDGRGDHVVASSLTRWAQDDPAGALEWVRKNAEKYPELVTDLAKRGVISGAARQDPRLAFQLIDELGLDPSKAGGGIVSAATSPAERTAVLAALREHLKTVGDPESRSNLLAGTVGSLGQSVLGDGYESAISWFESASLTAEETRIFASHLNPWQAKDDTGRWIEWMADKMPEDELRSKVGQMVGQWTRDDYQAAGEWINTSAEGPARRAAVESYAKTLAPYEPAVAAQWALSLPAGEERRELLEQVHSQWKSKDEAAAAEFAREHGLGE